MSSSLPDDINALKRLLAEQEALNRALLEKLNEREREIDHLQAQLDKLRRMNVGSCSEKVSRRIAQMEADLKALQKESDTLTGRVDDPAVQRPLRQTRTRKPFPESLPRDEKRLLPAASCCPECGGSLSYLGEDAAEQLELMRSAFRVIRTVREKHACTQCDAIVQAPAPSRPIERGIAGPGLLARVLTSKYAEHTPLYRQSEIYGRQGVELSRSLLSGWVDACCRQLSPLEEALHGYVLTDGKLHADDTPVPVLLPGNKKTKTGRLWTCVRDDRNAGSTLAPAVWFAYSPDRKGIHPQTHLAGFSGVLQADAYAAIERGIAGPGLLARVLTSKYAEHTPLYCQSEIYGRQGVELSRSLLSGWVDACCRLLSPLEEALHGYGTGAAGPRADLEVCRAHPAVLPVRNIRPARCGAEPFTAVGLGGCMLPAAVSAGRGASWLCAD